MIFPRSPQVFVATAPVDLRLGFDTLAALIVERFGRSPRDGALFVFLNKKATRTKVLFYHDRGYCLLHKRLDSGHFPRPATLDPHAPHVAISPDEMALFLRGLESAASPRRPKPPALH